MKEQTWTLFYKFSKEKYGNIRIIKGEIKKNKIASPQNPPNLIWKPCIKKKMYTKHMGEKYP